MDRGPGGRGARLGPQTEPLNPAVCGAGVRLGAQAAGAAAADKIFDGRLRQACLRVAGSRRRPEWRRKSGWNFERVSVMTVQRTLKKTTAASSEEVLADPAPAAAPHS